VGCVLRAFALIQRKHPEARLTVAGDGSQRAELEALARELKLEHVEFVGRVPPGRMPGLYDAADIYLNAPNIDNMPGSVIEAFAAGTPVVTTDAGGIPYIVADGVTGFVVPRGDADALAGRACRLLEDDRVAQTIIENARRECLKYSWEAVRDGWLGLYRELARGAGETNGAARGAHERAGVRTTKS
ncbi:MAG TPA: glycosyltransferase family 4 protein, partial [Pyrinomonadaceae bacterium]|nr:glycosyltransferase family 4 protein [Pyrinomonadaceae bacterium]